MKKMYLICSLLLMTILLNVPWNNVQAQTVWNGTTDVSWYSASQHSFNISTAEQLAGLAYLVNQSTDNFSGDTINLTADIMLNLVGSTANNWTPIGGSPTASSEMGGTAVYFCGTFLGHHHTIYNMYCNKSAYFQAGLFGGIRGSYISGLALVNPTVTSKGMMGALTGFVNGGATTITDCMVINAHLTGTGGNNIGCFVGANYGNYSGTTVSSCGATGTITGSYTGGFGGNCQYETFTNCYFAGSVTGTPMGGISAYDGTRNNCYSDVTAVGDGNSGTMMTDSAMRLASFVTSLDTTFMVDPGINNGFPVKNWMSYKVLVGGNLQICTGEATTLTAYDTAATYAWSTGATTSSITVSPTTTTTYTVTCTNPSNATCIDTVTVTVYPQAVITAAAMPSADDSIHGTVTPDISYVGCGSSTTVTLTIVPDANWHISKIVVNDSIVREDDPNDGSIVSYVVNPNGTLCDVKVYFYDKYDVTVTMHNQNNNAINNSHLFAPYGNSGVYAATAGNDLTYTFYQNSRYHISDVTVDGTAQGPISTYTFSNIQESHTVVITYLDSCGIFSLPMTENFDTYGSYVQPDCWTGSNSETYTYTFYSAPTSVEMYSDYWSGDAGTLISPIVDSTIILSSARLSFMARFGSVSSTLQIGIMTDPAVDSTFTTIATITPSAASAWLSNTIYFNNYTGNGHYIVFKYNTTSYYGCFIDDILIETAPTCSEVQNLTVSNVNGSNATLHWHPNAVGTMASYNVNITNETTGVTTTETTTDTNYVLLALTERTPYSVSVTTSCTSGDESTAQTVSFVTPCYNPVESTIGITTTSTNGQYLPSYPYYNYSYSQQIFRASELGNEAHDYNAMAFQYFSTSTGTRNLDIYLAHTTDSAFAGTGSWIPDTNFVKVHSGPITFNNAGTNNWFVIQFDTVFSYNGTDNLLLVVDDNTGSYYSSSERFYTNTGIANCAQYIYGDYVNYDPLNPPASSYSNACIAERNNVQFIYCGESTCIRPTNVVATNILNHSADIGWTPAGTETSWDIEYRPYGSGTWISGGSVSVYPTTISGLNANTVYEARVRANCGNNDVSPWNTLVTGTFRTDCDVITTLPYNDAFAATNVPSGTNVIPYCWNRFTSNPAHFVYWKSDVHHNASGSLDFHYTPNCYDIAVTPAFDNTISINTLAATVWVYAESITDGTMEIGVMGDPADSTTFVSIDTLRPAASATWEEFIVPFNTYSGTGHNIAFKYSGGTNHSYTIDDLNIDLIPNCITPNNITATGISTSQATIGWNERGTATAWVVEYDSTGFTPGTGTIVNASTNPIVITGLSASTTYDVYLKAVCPDGSNSNYSYVYTFNTPVCDSIDRCNFTFNLHDDYGDGWNGNKIKIYQNGILETSITLSSGHDATVNVPLCSNAALSLVWSTGYYASETSFNIVDPFGETTLYTCADGSSLTNNGTFYSDTVNCTPPFCPRPSNVTATALTTNSATLSWVDPGQHSTGWFVEYGATGFTPGTGTTDYTTTNSITLTNLTQATHYDVYVRTDCTTDTSIVTPVYSFITLCDEIDSLPFAENFDGITSNNNAASYLDCWSRYSSIANRLPYVGHWGSSYYHSSPNCLDFNNTPSGFNIAILPAFAATIPVNTLTISFWAQADNMSIGTMEVGVMTNPVDPTTFVSVDTVNALTSSTWNVYDIPLTAYQGTGQCIAFRYSNGTSVAWRMDNITVDHTPTCVAPNQLAGTASTTTSVTLGWNERGTATSWEIEYGTPGFAAGTGTSVTANTNPFTVTGLSSSITYSFRVRSVCSATDQSAWSDVASYATVCDVVTTFPYNEGFENSGNMPNCWTQSFASGTTSWLIGTGNRSSYSDVTTAHGGTYNALMYTSSSSGTDATKLISPMFDLTSVTSPVLRFWHSQQNWGGDQDALKVYYRTSSTDTWTQLAYYTNDISSWTQDTLALPNPSATYQIAFEGLPTYGYGVTLDDIFVGAGNGGTTVTCYAPTNVAASNISETGATITWTAGSTETQWILEYKVSTASNYTTVNVATTPSYALTGLTAGTAYNVRVKAVCDATSQSDYSTVYNFTTTTSTPTCPDPTNLHVTDVNAHTATLAWDQEAGTATSWEVNYKRADATTWTVTTTTTNPYQLVSLDSNTAYQAQVRAICGADNYSDFTAVLTFNTTVGINDYTLSNLVKIYPNPTNNNLNIVSSNANIKVEEAGVYDVYGKKIMDFSMEDSHATINVSSLSAGIYFVRMMSDEGIIVKQFIKR